MLDRLPALQGPPGARPVRDRDADVRVDRRDARRDRLPARRRAEVRRRGRRAGCGRGSERRRELVAGMVAIADYERTLVTPADRRPRGHRRHDDPRHHRSGAVRGPRPDRRRSRSTGSTRGPPRRRSARDGIYAWDGDFYATGLIERLGKAGRGGVLRLGLVHYNTAAEVDRTVESVARIAAGR